MYSAAISGMAEVDMDRRSLLFIGIDGCEKLGNSSAKMMKLMDKMVSLCLGLAEHKTSTLGTCSSRLRLYYHASITQRPK